MFGINGSVFEFFNLFFRLKNQLAFLAPLEPRVNGVADNGEEPGPRVAATKTAEELESAQTRFLDHVARIMLVAGKPAREVIGRIQMRQNRFFKVRGFVFHRR